MWLYLGTQHLYTSMGLTRLFPACCTEGKPAEHRSQSKQRQCSRRWQWLVIVLTPSPSAWGKPLLSHSAARLQLSMVCASPPPSCRLLAVAPTMRATVSWSEEAPCTQPCKDGEAASPSLLVYSDMSSGPSLHADETWAPSCRQQPSSYTYVLQHWQYVDYINKSIATARCKLNMNLNRQCCGDGLAVWC